MIGGEKLWRYGIIDVILLLTVDHMYMCNDMIQPNFAVARVAVPGILGLCWIIC